MRKYHIVSINNPAEPEEQIMKRIQLIVLFLFLLLAVLPLLASCVAAPVDKETTPETSTPTEALPPTKTPTPVPTPTPAPTSATEVVEAKDVPPFEASFRNVIVPDRADRYYFSLVGSLEEWQSSCLHPDNLEKTLNMRIPDSILSEKVHSITDSCDEIFFHRRSMLVLMYYLWGSVDNVTLSVTDGVLQVMVEQTASAAQVAANNYLCVSVDPEILIGVTRISVQIVQKGTPFVYSGEAGIDENVLITQS